MAKLGLDSRLAELEEHGFRKPLAASSAATPKPIASSRWRSAPELALQAAQRNHYRDKTSAGKGTSTFDAGQTPSGGSIPARRKAGARRYPLVSGSGE